MLTGGAAAGLHAGHGAGGRGRRLRHRRRLYRALAGRRGAGHHHAGHLDRVQARRLQRLAAHGRAQGSLIAVDITQAAGIVDVDVSAPAIDFAATTTLAALRRARLGPGLHQPGAAGRAPAAAGAGLVQPARSLQLGLDKYSLATQARRFDNGTPSFLPYVASAPGLSWLLSPAAQACARTTSAVAQADRAGRCQGYRLRSPRDASERGGSVMVELPAPIDAQALEARLATEGVLADTRGRCCACRRAC